MQSFNARLTLNLDFRLSHFLATWSGVIFPVRPMAFTIPLRRKEEPQLLLLLEDSRVFTSRPAWLCSSSR